jgi:hypothetical protein
VVFFPGVLLHEGSHFITAKLLQVRTGRFSIIRARYRTGGCRWVMWRLPIQIGCGIHSSERRH